MTTKQREDVRQALINAKFQRITASMLEHPKYYDAARRGAYTEVWQSILDNTLITLEWDYKSEE